MGCFIYEWQTFRYQWHDYGSNETTGSQDITLLYFISTSWFTTYQWATAIASLSFKTTVKIANQAENKSSAKCPWISHEYIRYDNNRVKYRIFVPMKASKTDKTNPIKLTGESPAIVQIASDDRGTDRMNNGSSIRWSMPAMNGRKMKRNPIVSDKNRTMDLSEYHSFARMIASLIDRAANTRCTMERRVPCFFFFVNLCSTSVQLNTIVAKNVAKAIAVAITVGVWAV